MAILPSSDWILYEIKLNFSKFDSSSDDNNDANNDENQTSEESTSTEGMFDTIESIDFGFDFRKLSAALYNIASTVLWFLESLFICMTEEA